MTDRARQDGRHHVVIIGGGFGGLNAAKAFRGADVDVTLVDKHNYHLFWPLLYQVATAGLSPGDIAAPLRAIFSRQRNVTVRMAEVTDIDPAEQSVQFADGRRLAYDSLIVAAGFHHHYFGNESWRKHALDLQGVDGALAIRKHILFSYESAEENPDIRAQRSLLTFTIVGAGPTGVELAGSIAELARHALRNDFRRIDPAQTRVLLVEADNRVLPTFPEALSHKAQNALEELGVEVSLNTRVLDVGMESVLVERNGATDRIDTGTVLWAAGVKASPLGEILRQRTGAELDRGGRTKVSDDLSIPGHPNIFVVGDMAHVEQNGDPLPGIAPVAMQEGTHAAEQILHRLSDKATEKFEYVDRGMMATIGRAAAVADIRGMKISGYIAWLLWLTIHLMFLVGFQNRFSVFTQWAWSYLTYGRGVRLIVEGEDNRRTTQAAQDRARSGGRDSSADAN